MPDFIRELGIKHVVLDDATIHQLNALLTERIKAHNDSQATKDPENQMGPIYVVRFDGRGYRTFSAAEAWGYYSNAKVVERLVLSAESRTSIKTNHLFGAYIEIWMEWPEHGKTYMVVGGDEKDWVEATYLAFEEIFDRRKDLATKIFRTEWVTLALQLLGVLVGVLLCLWLATLSAPFLKGVEYPRAVAFAFWFLIYGNLWGYLQHRAHAAIMWMFPNVRFARKGSHWTQTLTREGLRAAAIAASLWAFAWFTKWASSVLAPVLGV